MTHPFGHVAGTPVVAWCSLGCFRVSKLTQRERRAMTTGNAGTAGSAARPMLRGSRVTVRPGGMGDVSSLQEVLAEKSVALWWGEPESAERTTAKLRGDSASVLLVVEIDGQVALAAPVRVTHKPS